VKLFIRSGEKGGLTLQVEIDESGRASRSRTIQSSGCRRPENAALTIKTT